ncbi:MAG: group 1 truncated hemoglobin [Planctomycetota bacterium]|nr:group 1 truncated hemoglobin [Planctomycetota bacterium]
MNSVLMRYTQTCAAAVAALAVMMPLLLAGGCAGSQKQNKDFYTSGNREADQRADQRMAQAEQLKGEGEGSGDKSKLADTKRSLYDRLGGQQGLQSIADDFVTRAMADPRVNWERKGIIQGGLSIHHDRSMQWDASPEKVKALKTHLAQFLALASGGPTQYEGRQMKEAHGGLHITNAEFDASVGDMKATLDKMQIPNTEQKELLAIIETTRAQVVEEQ